jgi:BirA family biotin operon repressor/biotin-[acetyl-CoA-carboxylase] ligase
MMSALDSEALNAACAELALPWRVEVADEVTSTNDVLRNAAQAGEKAGQVLFAEAQTRGRGRRDNPWVTPKGRDLMVSLLLRPEAPVALWPRVTTLAALAICRAIEREFPLLPQIKWPNDVFLGDRKVAGLLAEAVAGGDGMALVLGIGLNVNTCEFPPELTDTATSLLQELPMSSIAMLDRQRLAVVLLGELHDQLQRLEEDFNEVVAEVRVRSRLFGRQIRATVEGREIFGRALDLNGEGHLMLSLQDGTVVSLASADGVRQVL